MKKIALVIMLLVLSGCIKHQYDNINLQLAATSSKKIGVGVHDMRPYVVSGNKRPSFVGLHRRIYGNPVSVSTKSQRPLADDLTDGIVNSLSRKGINTTGMYLEPASNNGDVTSSLIGMGNDKSILFILKEWKSDTYMNTMFHYDVTLRVLDDKGATLASKHIKGVDTLGLSPLVPQAKEIVRASFPKKLENLLNDPEVIQALK